MCTHEEDVLNQQMLVLCFMQCKPSMKQVFYSVILCILKEDSNKPQQQQLEIVRHVFLKQSVIFAFFSILSFITNAKKICKLTI